MITYIMYIYILKYLQVQSSRIIKSKYGITDHTSRINKYSVVSGEKIS